MGLFQYKRSWSYIFVMPFVFLSTKKVTAINSLKKYSFLLVWLQFLNKKTAKMGLQGWKWVKVPETVTGGKSKLLFLLNFDSLVVLAIFSLSFKIIKQA